MGGTVLCTGPPLAAEAYTALERHGLGWVDTPADASGAELASLARRHEVDAIVVRTGAVTAEVVHASPKLRLIVKHGIGVDNIDLSAATARGVPVVNVPDAIADAVAEMTVTMLFALAKHLCRLDRALHNGVWQKSLVGTALSEQTLGCIGMGRIARKILPLVSPLSIEVVAYDKYVPAKRFPDGVGKMETLNELLAVSDTVVVLCPKTPETIGLIGEAELDVMKDTAFLINTARGGIVDEAALAKALNSGKIAGAALDTFEHEPLDPNSPLIGCENIVLTPHVAASTASALRRTGVRCAEIASGFLEGGPLDRTNLINRDVRFA